jgi:hypothetical protein
MKSHLIHIVYSDQNGLQIGDDVVLVDAQTQKDARELAMRQIERTPHNSFVRFYDENGIEIEGSSR